MNWYRVNKVLFLSSLILCFCLFTVLFYKMATTDYETDWSPYYSDIIYHIRAAMSTGTYSLMGIIMKVLYTLSYNFASFLLALFISAMVIFTVYATYLLQMELDKVTGRETRTIDRAIYLWFSLISIFIVSVYIPDLLPSYYFKALNMTCWHNDTYLAMRPFAILAIVYFIRIYNGFDSGLDRKGLLTFGLILFISTWMKPNFFIGFSIVLFIVAIWCLIRKNEKAIVFRRLVMLAVSTIPSVICLLLQNMVLYSGDAGGDTIILDPFLLVELRVINWPIALVFLMIFPLIVLLFESRYLNRKSFGYAIIWLLWMVLNFFTFFLAEDGPRLMDFNFAWGMSFANGLLYIGTYYIWYSRLRICFCDKVSYIESNPKLSKGLVSAYLVIGLLILIYLAYVGISYFILIYNGTSFAKL